MTPCFTSEPIIGLPKVSGKSGEAQSVPVPAATAGMLRRGILLILLFGSAGTFVELLLIGHFEDWWQLLPLVLLGAVALLGTIAWRVPGRRVLAWWRALMVACVLSGVEGNWLHYSGNVEFEREMYPDRAGMELFRESMAGATPVLAPGTMTVIGLLGLVFAWRHPGSEPRRPRS